MLRIKEMFCDRIFFKMLVNSCLCCCIVIKCKYIRLQEVQYVQNCIV